MEEKNYCKLVTDIDFFLGKARKHVRLASRELAKRDPCELSWQLSLAANALEDAAKCLKETPQERFSVYKKEIAKRLVEVQRILAKAATD